VAILVHAWDERRQERNRLIAGCLVFGWDEDIGLTPRIQSSTVSENLDQAACDELLEALLHTRRARAHPRGEVMPCHAVVKPIVRGRKRPTARRHRQLTRMLNASVRARCGTPGPGYLAIDVRPRGRGNTVRSLLGSRARAGYGRSVPQGASDGPNAKLTVSWRRG
jgi:hypothetical protein